MSNKVHVSEETKKKLNRKIFGTDYPKKYESVQQEAKLDPEFFPEELRNCEYVVEIIESQKNKLSQIIPKLRKELGDDVGILNAEHLIKTVFGSTYDIYDGDTSIEYLRRRDIIKTGKDGKKEIDQGTVFLWRLLCVLKLLENVPGEYTFAVILKVFAGEQNRFPDISKQVRAGQRARISKGEEIEEIEDDRQRQRLAQEERIWKKDWSKNKEKKVAIMTILLSKSFSKIARYVNTFKARRGFKIAEKLRQFKDSLSP